MCVVWTASRAINRLAHISFKTLIWAANKHVCKQCHHFLQCMALVGVRTIKSNREQWVCVQESQRGHTGVYVCPDGCLKFWHSFFSNGEEWGSSDIRYCWQCCQEWPGCDCALCRCGMVLEAQSLVPGQGESEWGHCTPQAVSWAGCLCLFWMWHPERAHITAEGSTHLRESESVQKNEKWWPEDVRNQAGRISENMPSSTESSFHCQEAAPDKFRLWVGVWSRARVSEPKICSHNQLLVTDGLILGLEVRTRRLLVLRHICLVLLSSLGVSNKTSSLLLGFTLWAVITCSAPWRGT